MKVKAIIIQPQALTYVSLVLSLVNLKKMFEYEYFLHLSVRAGQNRRLCARPRRGHAQPHQQAGKMERHAGSRSGWTCVTRK